MTEGPRWIHLDGYVGDDVGHSIGSADVFGDYVVRYEGTFGQRLRRRVAVRRRIVGDLRHAPAAAVALIVVVFAVLATTPAVAAVAIGRIVNGLVVGDIGDARVWAVVVASVLLIEQVIPPLIEPVRELVRSRIDEAVRADLRRTVAAARGIEGLEDQRVLDDADVVSRWLGTWTYGEGVEGQIAVFFVRWVKGVLSTLVIMQLSVIVAIAVWVIRLAQNEYLLRMYRRGTAIVMGQVPLRRASRYWGEIAGRGEAAKELRTFGFGPWAVNLHHLLARRMHQLSFDYVLHILPRQWPASVAAGSAAVLAGVVAVRAAAQPDADLASITAGLTAAIYFMSGVMAGEAPFAYEAARLIDRARTRLETTLAETGGSPGPDPLPDRLEVIRFVDVDFAYPGTTEPVLSSLNLQMRRGESTAIVGENGSGKTTLIKLLAGLYRPTSGRIEVEGPGPEGRGRIVADLADVDMEDWRRHLAVIFQDFTRFELSAADNIALVDLGSADVARHVGRDDDVDWAVAAAAADTVVDTMPDGLATMMSRRFTGGTQLSGGQWQRIALARAFYGIRRGRSLLVMDEPTASLDVGTELAIVDRTLAVADDVFTIVLSHRFSTVRRVDRIIVLAQGRAVEDGSHDSLMTERGHYRRMYESQAGLYGRSVEWGESGG